jgi:hypothetical protein
MFECKSLFLSEDYPPGNLLVRLGRKREFDQVVALEY